MNFNLPLRNRRRTRSNANLFSAPWQLQLSSSSLEKRIGKALRAARWRELAFFMTDWTEFAVNADRDDVEGRSEDALNEIWRRADKSGWEITGVELHSLVVFSVGLVDAGWIGICCDVGRIGDGVAGWSSCRISYNPFKIGLRLLSAVAVSATRSCSSTMETLASILHILSFMFWNSFFIVSDNVFICASTPFNS